MTLLYPAALWILIPLGMLLWKSTLKLQSFVHILILMLLLISLSRPIEKQALQEADIQARDIIIALDVSYSMRATDLPPTRYAFAKETIKILLKQNPSDNIMLVAFTSNPLLLSPPTTDHALIYLALQSLNIEFILTKGTSLENLFKKLSTMHLEEKSLILITDGGEESNIDTLSSLLQEIDTSVHILALGTQRGSAIQTSDGSLLKDEQGNLVISRINPLLESLAKRAGGTYMTASHSAKASANKLNTALRQQTLKKQKIQKMQRQHKEWYQLPLMLALLLFLMLHTRAIKYLVVIFAFFGVHTQASFLDLYHLQQSYQNYEKHIFNAAMEHLKKIQNPSLQSQFALANSYYKEEAFSKAIQVYKSIQSKSPTVKQALYYNIANAYAKLKAYDKAKTYYTKALQLGKEVDALYNLNLIALLVDKTDASLGIAHPKSQSSDSSKSESQEKLDEQKEDQPSSGSSGGGDNSIQEEKKKQRLLPGKNDDKHPLSSKAYELINKGYIRETQPW